MPTSPCIASSSSFYSIDMLHYFLDWYISFIICFNLVVHFLEVDNVVNAFTVLSVPVTVNSLTSASVWPKMMQTWSLCNMILDSSTTNGWSISEPGLVSLSHIKSIMGPVLAWAYELIWLVVQFCSLPIQTLLVVKTKWQLLSVLCTFC